MKTMRMQQVVALVLVIARADATGHGGLGVDRSAEHLRQLIASSRPNAADPQFDCAWRRLAWAYAPTLQQLSSSKSRELHDALELEGLCGQPFVEPPPHAPHPPTWPSASVAGDPTTVFVAPDGDDSAAGTLSAPLRTIHGALGIIRARRPSLAMLATIVLRQGTYLLGTTLRLSHLDSHLRITAYEGEAVNVSGAVRLSPLQWTRDASKPGLYVARLSRAHAAALTTDSPHGPMAALRLSGRRVTRARYPNANPELDLFPTGYIADKTSWLTPTYPPYNQPASRPCAGGVQCGQSTNVSLPAPSDEWHGMYQSYEQGYGGACEVFDPPRSPWCAGPFYGSRMYRADQMHARMPSGIAGAGAHLPNSPYKTADGALVVAWRPSHWYTWMFGVKAQTVGPVPAAASLLFGSGGNQGAEGADRADEWFIENVAEELDAPNEFFFDVTTNELRLVYNGTGSPPTEVEVPTLATLIAMHGSLGHPVANVTLEGITFRDTRPTFLEARGTPSGGDWALERIGAIELEGSEDVAVRGCRFTHLDSNALLLSGYNRRTLISANEFAWLGQNAIASWGRLSGETNSGLSGEQPHGTVIEANWAHDLGIIQKQSSFYFQAITARATLRRNIVFNIPRAAINFNDGFGGGHLLRENLLFNTCRESADHGAFNSWDRLPYVSDVRDGTPSTIPAFNEATANLIVANYGADGGCLDNDDGSSYYRIHHNVCVYGGHKSDFDGHSKLSYSNLHIYANVYGVKCIGELQALPKQGYAEGYYNNTCILGGAKPTYARFANCPGGLGSDPASLAAFAAGMSLGNNTVYSAGVEPLVSCGSQTINVSDFFERGYDRGSTVSAKLPSADTIADWARMLLGM